MLVQLPYIRRITARTRKQRQATELLVADAFEIDIPELSAAEAPLASVMLRLNPEKTKAVNLIEKTTVWHDDAHWGVLAPFASTDRMRQPGADMVERFLLSAYDAKTVAAFKTGKLVSAHTHLDGIGDDRRDEDLGSAVEIALTKFRVVEGRPVFQCDEPLLSVKVLDRSKTGQSQGFTPWFAVELVPASGAGPKAGEMLFRFDQLDRLRSEFEGDRLPGLEEAISGVEFKTEGAYVKDIWTASAMTYLQRRVKELKLDLKPIPRHDYVLEWQDFASFVAECRDDSMITEAFGMEEALYGRNPDPFDTRWMTRTSREHYQAHWEGRPINLDIEAKPGRRGPTNG